jgi:K319-like protein
VTITVVGQQTPLVNAGANQLVSSAAAVTLTGSAIDPAGAAGQPLSFQWTQTSGTPVTLTGANTATATFTAPAMTAGQGPLTLGFKLTVNNALGASGSATTNVTVQPIADTVTITSAIWRLRKSQLTVTAVSSVTNGSPVLTLHIPGHADVPMVFDPVAQAYVAGTAPAGQLTVNPAPSTVSASSSFGGSASSSVTIR